MKIITHQSPDIDAIAGLYLYVKLKNLTDYELGFWPEEGDVYIDCQPANSKSNSDKEVYDHHKDLKFASATEVVYETLKDKISDPKLKVYKKFTNAISLLDSAKYPAVQYTPVLLTTYISGLKLYTKDDKLVINKLFEIFDAIIIALEMYEKAKLTPVEINILNGYKIVSYELSNTNNGNPAPYYFLEENADFIIYKSGKNIGIVRNSNLTSPSLENLKKYIDEEGWFFHPAGFIAARGTHKYPANKESKYTIKDLVNFVAKLTTEYRKDF